MSLLSVIIPVYKVQQYLHQCVDSVLAQTYGQIDVILVDDGSPDACPEICDDYARRDKRVRVIHQHNKGLSAARNAGLDIAEGDFIAFVDSDDYISKNYFEVAMLMFDKTTDLDIVQLPMMSRFNTKSNSIIAPDTTDIIRGQENVFQQWFCRKGYLNAYSQNKICRRHLFDNVRFPVGKTFEDLHIITHLLQKANSIAFAAYPEAYYFYRWRDDSITAQARWTDLDSQTTALQDIALMADAYNIPQRQWAHFVVTTSNILADNIKAAKREKLTSDITQYNSLINILQDHKPSIANAFTLNLGWKATLKALVLSTTHINNYLKVCSIN